ncbi:hypothetical protein [Nocardia sp. NBC_00403]|uniref:hypothetical protein n=1 Tax=Nocardia sp. NBC_00403 TaxID=2975990 RepID=UPI002E220F10
MPNSSRNTAALSRMACTGEVFEAARAGTGRNRAQPLEAHGLDHCLPAQRDLRALLAYAFCMRDDGATEGPASWDVSILSAYTITMSPRFSETVLITDAPDNVTGRLLGLPGLRLRKCCGGDTFVMRHLPTGADLVVTAKPSGQISTREHRSWRPITMDEPLTAHERSELADVPHMSNDAKRLLGGIFCRISTSDPAGKWAIGNWFYDPIRVFVDGPEERSRTLSGIGDAWELRWGPYPYADDLAASLTSQQIGLADAYATTGDNHLVLGLGKATIRLYGKIRPLIDRRSTSAQSDSVGGAR